MKTALRPLVAAATVATLAGILAGCSLFPSGPERDADGQVTESAAINSTDLLTGDCFDYIGDGSDLSTVTIIPCSADHVFKVIDEGTLTVADADAAGGLQNAVSGACKEVFATFKATLAESDLRTKLSFLVSTDTVDGEDITAYSCVAEDPKADPAAEEPAEGEDG
jgi:hypothetical protein